MTTWCATVEMWGASLAIGSLRLWPCDAPSSGTRTPAWRSGSRCASRTHNAPTDKRTALRRKPRAVCLSSTLSHHPLIKLTAGRPYLSAWTLGHLSTVCTNVGQSREAVVFSIWMRRRQVSSGPRACAGELPADSRTRTLHASGAGQSGRAARAGEAGPLAWQRFLALVDGCCTEGADALRSSPPPSATTPRAAWSGQQRAAPKTSLT
jgi:hypothetical protein